MVVKRAVVQAVAVVARVAAAAVQPAAAVAVVQVAGVAAAPVRTEAAAVKDGAAATATAVKAAVAGTVIVVIASVKVESARLIAAQATGVEGATEAGTGIATAIETATETVTAVVIMIEIGTRIGPETGIATEIAIGTAHTKAQGFTTLQTMETIATVPTPTSAATRTAYLRAPVMDGAVKASIRNARTSTDAVTLGSSQSSARAIRISRHIGTVFYAATRKASKTGKAISSAGAFIDSTIDLRKRSCGVNLTTMKATNREPEIVTRNGKPVSVILPIKEYEELLERAEDSEDLVWLRRARRKKLHYRALEDYLAKRNLFNQTQL